MNIQLVGRTGAQTAVIESELISLALEGRWGCWLICGFQTSIILYASHPLLITTTTEKDHQAPL